MPTTAAKKGVHLSLGGGGVNCGEVDRDEGKVAVVRRVGAVASEG